MHPNIVFIMLADFLANMQQAVRSHTADYNVSFDVFKVHLIINDVDGFKHFYDNQKTYSECAMY